MCVRRFALAILTFLACSRLYAASPNPPPLPGNWNLAFDQEFGAMPGSGMWKQSLWGLTSFPGESEIYDPSAVSVNNGIFSLTATKQTLSGYNYVSGLINTGPIYGQQPTGYSFTYGYVDARMKLPAGQGLWPAFWLLPDPNPLGGYNDALGEIDVMEELGNQPTIDQVHYHQNGNQWGTGISAGVDLSQGFHDYAVNWQPGKIDWYLDGNLIYSVNQAPSVAEYLILNLAVGAAGSWPGAPDATTPFPSALQVQSVQVWQDPPAPEPASAWVGTALLTSLLFRRPNRCIPTPR